MAVRLQRLLFIVLAALAGQSAHAASIVPAAPLPSKSSTVTLGRPEPVPIAFVYRDRASDSAWSASHELARNALVKEFGGRIATIAVENVATTNDADRVFAELVARGYKVIFATDAVHATASAKVAAADYDVKIEQAMGTQTLINVRTYEIRHVEQAYLAGIVAAGNSRSRKLGVVAAVPTPAALLEINAFARGAQSVDKRMAVQLVWSGSATDFSADTRAAERLIARGVDVLLSTTDIDAVARVAERRNRRVIGWHVDRAGVAPRAQVAALVLDWAPFYRVAVNQSFSYFCSKSDTSRGVKEGAIKIVRLGNTISGRARDTLRRAQSGFESGQLQVFARSNPARAGQTVPAERATDDAAWRTAQQHLLRGMTVVDGTRSGP